jgi:hypothetical protein
VFLTSLGTRSGSVQSSLLEQEFEATAKQYSVPKEMLLAMGYVDTRWVMPPVDASDYEEGSLEGKADLRDHGARPKPYRRHFGDAAKATSISVQTFKTDPQVEHSGRCRATCEAIGNEVGSLERMVRRGGR